MVPTRPRARAARSKDIAYACILSLGIASACGDDTDSGMNGSVPDGSVPPDVGDMDTGMPDAGPVDSGMMSDPLEIVGVWVSNFGGEEVITDEAFNDSAIREFDNLENLMITQNSTASEFNPGLFNRIEWTDILDDSFYYCFVEFGLASLEVAQTSTLTADASDPENQGCGDFSWTQLRRALSIRGEYISSFDLTETITATAWTLRDESMSPILLMSLVDWDEQARWVITQNFADSDALPGLFNRIEFTEPLDAGSFFYCITEFGLDTAEEARTSTLSADPSDPARSGCIGDPWTRLDPR